MELGLGLRLRRNNRRCLEEGVEVEVERQGMLDDVEVGQLLESKLLDLALRGDGKRIKVDIETHLSVQAVLAGSGEMSWGERFKGVKMDDW